MKKSHIVLLCAALVGGCGVMVWLWPHRSQQKATAPAAKPVAARSVPAISLPVSSPIYILTEESVTTPARKLLSVIHAFPAVLTQPEQSALTAVLRGGLKNMALSPGERYHVANDLMLALRTRREMSVDLVRILGQMARDKAVDPVLRDYALQHIGSALADGDRWKESRESGLEALFTAAANPQLSSCGTALLALMEVKDAAGDFPIDRLGAASDAAVLSPSINAAALTSAMLVCATIRDAKTVNPALRQRLRGLAGDAARTPAVRASALAALGRLGEVADLSLFESLLSDDRLGDAARGATAILKGRVSSSAKSL